MKNSIQKQIVPIEKSFKKELFELLISLNLPEFPNKMGNKQFTSFQKLACVILRWIRNRYHK